MTKAPKGLYPESQDISYGGAIAGQFRKSILNIFQKVVPKLRNTKSPKEGIKVLYREIEAEISLLGIGDTNELGSKLIEDIIKNSKVEYKHDRVCVTYRKFKKCMKLDRK